MSLLEDLFLQDEAGEAQELERVLEGGGEDEYEGRPVSPTSDDNEEREDEAEEDKRRVDPTQGKVKRVVKNPRFVLNPARLTGPRGIQVIPDHFKDFKFKGKGHEKEDIDMVLKKLEHWAYRLYPKFEFHDCLKKIETLGKKKSVMVHLQKIRSDQFVSEETVVQKDSSDEEAAPPEEDEFDKLLQQQIELARATPGPGSVKKPAFSTPSIDRSHMMPKATSSPSISEEQRERMLRNRRLAEERRLAKLRNDNSTVDLTNIPEITTNVADVVRKHNRSNVIDSSDDEVGNESIIIDADVHSKAKHTENNVELIDITESNAETTKDADVIIRRHNKSNVVDSSDDEQVSFVNETISIPDIHNKAKNTGNDVEIIDITKSNAEATTDMADVVVRRHNRSNVIDSSDDEEVGVANQSITIDVDVHSRGNKENDVEIVENPKNYEEMVTEVERINDDFDSLITATDSVKDCIDVESNAEKETNPIEAEAINDCATVSPNLNTESNYENQNGVKNNKRKSSEDEKVEERNVITESSEANIAKDKEALHSNKENVDSNVTEDIMDVDFNDDF